MSNFINKDYTDHRELIPYSNKRKKTCKKISQSMDNNFQIYINF